MIDNYDLWEQHDREMERELSRQPICEEMNEYIQDEYCYEVEGEILSEEGFNRRYRVEVNELMEKVHTDSLPECSYCDREIDADYMWIIEGEFYCEECKDKEFKKRTEDLAE